MCVKDTLLAMDTKVNELLQIFRPFFMNLLEIFIDKLKLPFNYDEWSDDEKERLRCYRIDIGDTMVYMIGLIGEVMLEFIIKRLMSTIEAAAAGPTGESTTAADWKLQEALIYMLQSVVSELNESCSPYFSCTNDNYLTGFIQILPRINYSNKHILSTTLLAVGLCLSLAIFLFQIHFVNLINSNLKGSLGSWLERNTHLLENAISLTLLGLKTDAVTQSASFALKDIINDCDLSAYSDQIILTCQVGLPLKFLIAKLKLSYFFSNQECLKKGTVAQNYEVRLMSIIGLCLSDLLCIDMARAQAWLSQIVDPYLVKLAELSQLKTVDKPTQALTCHILNLISQLMSSIVQRQKTYNDEMQNSTNLTSNSLSNSMLNSNEEKVVVNSILIKLLPIYKQIITRNLPTDLLIIDVWTAAVYFYLLL